MAFIHSTTGEYLRTTYKRCDISKICIEHKLKYTSMKNRKEHLEVLTQAERAAIASNDWNINWENYILGAYPKAS